MKELFPLTDAEKAKKEIIERAHEIIKDKLYNGDQELLFDVEIGIFPERLDEKFKEFYLNENYINMPIEDLKELYKEENKDILKDCLKSIIYNTNDAIYNLDETNESDIKLIKKLESEVIAIFEYKDLMKY